MADVAGISTAHLSAMLSGTKGATDEIVEKLTNALSQLSRNGVTITPGVLFPELVQFRTAVRHFAAPREVA